MQRRLSSPENSIKNKSQIIWKHRSNQMEKKYSSIHFIWIINSIYANVHQQVNYSILSIPQGSVNSLYSLLDTSLPPEGKQNSKKQKTLHFTPVLRQHRHIQRFTSTVYSDGGEMFAWVSTGFVCREPLEGPELRQRWLWGLLLL